jgi:RNA 2',3'-cyclic 3'-phosphodiesterase
LGSALVPDVVCASIACVKFSGALIFICIWARAGWVARVAARRRTEEKTVLIVEERPTFRSYHRRERSQTAYGSVTLSEMRLFIGIALAPEASDALRGVQERFALGSADLRWSRPESWHVTLQFLGSTTEAQFACVQEKLIAVKAAKVPVRIAALGFFERAGVFWAGVDLTSELLALQQRVTAATRPCGFMPEERAYHPHITLARSKRHEGAKSLAPLKKAVEHSKTELEARFIASEFLLYESFPGAEGSRYEVQARFGLE